MLCFLYKIKYPTIFAMFFLYSTDTADSLAHKKIFFNADTPAFYIRLILIYKSDK